MKINHLLMVVLIAVLSIAVTNCSQNKKHGFNRVHFDTDKSFIRNDMVKRMDQNVAQMKKRKRHFSTESPFGHQGAWGVTVEGHCDERGSNEYNYALGQRRADSAKSFMVMKGISPDRIKTMSYGEDRPLKKGHNESAWWLSLIHI